MKQRSDMKHFYPLFFTATLLFSGCTSISKEQKKAIYTSDKSKKAFTHPLKLNREEEDRFILGKSFFRIPWVEAPSATTARDGLGPLFNANTCQSCHPNNSSGIALNGDGSVNRALLLRLSNVDNKNMDNALIKKIGFIPDPTYGVQLAVNGNMKVPFEGVVESEITYIKGTYSEGSSYELRTIAYKAEKLNYGVLSKNTNIAPRLALPLIGMGFLEDISAEDILSYEDINDSDKDGISGRANWVYSPEKKRVVLGRFAYKATAETVKHQTANAAHNDMGLTNPLYPNENCTEQETACMKANRGSDRFDMTEQRLDAIAFYLKSLKIPKQRVDANFTQGQKIFRSIGCAKCHRETFHTKSRELIHPYSDLLLHDMGKDLDDGHSDFKASSSEFRTTPLWGIGLRAKISGAFNLLHDGRARSFEEAILWHGGEAQSARDAFKALEKQYRNYLVDFLKGL